MSELDPVTRQGEQILRSLLRDFAFSFRGLSRHQIPAMTLRIADRPQSASSIQQKEMTVTRPVFDAFAAALAREAKTSLEEPKQRYLQVMSFGQSSHPWFDISIEASDRCFVFKVCRLHDIAHPVPAKAS